MPDDPAAATLRLAVDANALYAALLRDGTARRLATDARLRLFAPRHLITEVRRHLPEIVRRAEVPGLQIERALSTLLAPVTLVHRGEYLGRVPGMLEEFRILGPWDVRYLAVAEALGLDGVWSDDKDLRRQNRVLVFTTVDLALQFPPRGRP